MKTGIKRTIKWKLYSYYILLFAIFFVSTVIFQNGREKQFRVAQLETRLNEFTDLVNRFVVINQLNSSSGFSRLDSLNLIFPADGLRITIIDLAGTVLYDNRVSDYPTMENHLNRPEFKKAIQAGKSYNIRRSVTTSQEYFYYARLYNNLVVRAAIVYNSEIRDYLKAGHAFLIYFVLLFLVFGFFIGLIANRLGDSITKLKDLALKIRKQEPIENEVTFANDELGVISNEIMRLYEKTRKVKQDLQFEKEKLISHLFVLKEGVAFFNKKKKIILNNSHFIQYLNIISEESTISIEKIFEIEEFRAVNSFVDKIATETISIGDNELPRIEFSVQRDGFHFLIQCIIFQDKSFEIIITDDSQLVKRRIMKQQITSNISHELKTPIASVKGYLETVLNNPGLEKSRIQYFVNKAFKQSERLTQLVGDLAMLNKIEESAELYPRENVKVKKVIGDVIESFTDALKSNNLKVEIDVDENVEVTANFSLVFSIFRNLMENSLNYGGENITITITKYYSDNNFHYFSYSDNGTGVDQEHLPRLFERFYRVDSGRSRKLGGTGLGLAIVKNAVLSFKGDISVRSRKGGGLEFLMSLPK